MGRGRAGQNPAVVETLFPEHAGPHLRGGQQRQGAHRRGQGRADAHAGGGRAAGRRPADIRQQAGPAQRDERRRDNGQAGAALAAQPQLVHSGDVRDQRRRPLRGARLAIQPAQERQPLAPHRPRPLGPTQHSPQTKPPSFVVRSPRANGFKAGYPPTAAPRPAPHSLFHF